MFQYIRSVRVEYVRRTNIICNDCIHRSLERARKYKACEQTDRQTDRQIDRHIYLELPKQRLSLYNTLVNAEFLCDIRSPFVRCY